MTTKSLAQLVLLASLGIVSTVSTVFAQDRGRDGDRGRSGDRDSRSSAERFFSYMDRNRDGRLDSEETRRMPSSFREAFQRAEYNLDRGISRDDFIREMPRVMEEARRRREEDYRNRNRNDDDDRRREYYRRREEERRREEDRRRSDDNRSSYVYKPSKRDRVTMEIPRGFEDGDTDKDGQIGLYEWRQWRPHEKYHFRVYDINGDGFLTPKELSIPPTQEEINNYLTSIGVKIDTNSSSSPEGNGRSRNGGSRDGSSSTGGGSPQQTNASEEPTKSDAVPEQNERYAKAAMLFFKRMDADNSGKITSEEWARSEKLKPKFVKAGYDLSQPMDQQQFIAAYTAAYSKP